MSDPTPIIINGKPLLCLHCHGSNFTQRQVQLNTAAMTFLNLDWMNRSATVFHCQQCGRLEWFLDPVVAEKEFDPTSEASGTPWENNPDHTSQ